MAAESNPKGLVCIRDNIELKTSKANKDNKIVKALRLLHDHQLFVQRTPCSKDHRKYKVQKTAKGGTE